MLPEPLNYRGAKARIAEACGLAKQTVSAWKRIPSAHVMTVARAFNIAPERLLPGPRVERAVMPVAYERAVKSPQVRSRGPAAKPPRGRARAQAEKGGGA